MADITVKGLQPATSIDLATPEEIKADDRHGPVSDDAQLALWIKPLACPSILPPAVLCGVCTPVVWRDRLMASGRAFCQAAGLRPIPRKMGVFSGR
jgi:hypothetical protein